MRLSDTRTFLFQRSIGQIVPFIASKISKKETISFESSQNQVSVANQTYVMSLLQQTTMTNRKAGKQKILVDAPRFSLFLVSYPILVAFLPQGDKQNKRLVSACQITVRNFLSILRNVRKWIMPVSPNFNALNLFAFSAFQRKSRW